MNTVAKAKPGVLSEIAARHQAHWQADRWYARAWIVGPQAASALLAAWLLVPAGPTNPAPPAAPWYQPPASNKPRTPPGPAQQAAQPNKQNAPGAQIDLGGTASSKSDQQACTQPNVDNSASSNQNLEAAAATCSRLIETLPRNDPWFVEAYYNRGRIRIRLQQYPAAIEDFNQALAVNPNGAGSLVFRGDAYSLSGRQDLAMADYSAAQRLNPTWVLPVSRLADEYYAKGDYDRAESTIAEAMRLAPRDLFVLETKTQLSFKRNKWVDVVADATAWISVAPNAAAPYYYRGAAKDELNDPNSALADLAQAERMGWQRANLYNSRSSAYEKLGNQEQAQAALATSLKIDPKGVYPRLRRAQIAYDKGQWTEASGHVDEILAINPEDRDALILSARISGALGNDSDGLVTIDRVLAKWPNDVYAAYLRSLLFLYGEVQTIEPCKKFGHASADRSRWVLGPTPEFKCRQGPDIAGAIRELDRIAGLLKANPSPCNACIKDVYEARGTGHLWLGDRNQAERDFRTALSFSPADAGVLDVMRRAGMRP
jgi:tetratricopeptide (TPR) repeat protein